MSRLNVSASLRGHKGRTTVMRGQKRVFAR
jgi:hypothetical protein